MAEQISESLRNVEIKLHGFRFKGEDLSRNMRFELGSVLEAAISIISVISDSLGEQITYEKGQNYPPVTLEDSRWRG